MYQIEELELKNIILSSDYLEKLNYNKKRLQLFLLLLNKFKIRNRKLLIQRIMEIKFIKVSKFINKKTLLNCNNIIEIKELINKEIQFIKNKNPI